MRVAWLTADYFLDTDEQVIPLLQERFDIFWIILRAKDSWVTSRNVARAKNCENFVSRFRARDPRLLLDFLKVIRKLRATKPDVVYLGLVGLPYFHLLADLLLPKSKVVCAVHNVDDYPGWGSRWMMRAYMRRMFKRFRFFHLFSRHTERSLLKLYPGATTFYAPMALKDCGEAPRKRDESKVRFLFFGGVRPNKNLSLLIRAFNRLPAQLREQAVLSVAGSCPKEDVAHYRELAGSDPSIQLDFRRVPDQEIPELFQAHHFLVLPYDHVAQSGPQMIAYNYRLPVIATDIPGFRERIDDRQDGYLFRPGEEEHLSDVLAEAIRSHADRYTSLLEHLEGRIAKEWDPEVVSGIYETMFNQVGGTDREGGRA